MSYWAYRLHCADTRYSIGHTYNLDQRFGARRGGTVVGYTLTRRPLQLIWSQEFSIREEAFTAERKIKGCSRANTEALIQQDWQHIQRRARRTKNPLPERLCWSACPSIRSHRSS